MKSFFSSASIVAICLASAPAVAKVSVDLGKASEKKVTFVAIGRPSALRIEGVGDGISGTLTKDGAAIGGEAAFDLSTFDTGVSLRNKHMKEKYLEVEKFPKATLKITKLPWGPDDAQDFAAVDGPFEGEITLHGVTKPVSGPAKISRQNGVVKADVQFKMTIPDFKIDIPSFMGVTVAETVDVHVELQAAAGS